MGGTHWRVTEAELASRMAVRFTTCPGLGESGVAAQHDTTRQEERHTQQ